MAVSLIGATPVLMGKSTDTKPTVGIENGRQFVEFDTGKLYVYDGDSGEWVEFGSAGA